MFSNQETKKSLKQGVDTKGSSRRIQQMSLTLRHKKRDEALQKKRQGHVHEDPAEDYLEKQNSAGQSGFVEQQQNVTFDKNTNPKNIPLSMLDTFVNAVNSINPEERRWGTMMIRKLISVDLNPPIDKVLEAGLLPVFCNFLQNADDEELKFEAAWALSNIASGDTEQTVLVIRQGCVPLFVRYLRCGNFDLREQCCWALGNIAGEGAKCRNYLLEHQALPAILETIQDQSNPITVVRNATWALSNLCRSKPSPALQMVAPALPLLKRLIEEHPDEEVVGDACWAISYISDGPPERVEATLNAGILPRVLQLLNHSLPAMQVPAIRTIGNIATGNDVQTQMIIDGGALNAFPGLLQAKKRSIRKETCWTISNVTAGTKPQIQAILQAGLIPPVLEAMQTGEFEVKKEAAWAVANATSGGSPEQIDFLVRAGCLQPITRLLEMHDARVIVVALETLENILRVGADIQVQMNLPVNPYCQQLSGLGAISVLEDLQSHPNEEVFERTEYVLSTYFPDEDGGDGAQEGGTPQQQQQQQQQFQVSDSRFGLSTSQPGGFKFM